MNPLWLLPIVPACLLLGAGTTLLFLHFLSPFSNKDW